MLQLLGGPTVQPPSKRAPTVCNLISRFPSVDGRRGIKGKEVWRARLRRNGILNTIGKGFESELEAVICVQKYLLVELKQVYSAIQSPLVPYTNLTAPSATDPSAKAKAHDNQAAQSVREVLPSAGSPFLYLPALRTGKQEAEDLVSPLVESQGQFSRFYNGDMVALAITCGNYTVIRKLPNGRSWLPSAYNHGDSAESTAQRLLSDIGFPEVAQHLEKLGTHAVQDAEQGIVYMKCFGAKLKKNSDLPADQFFLQWCSITDFFTALAGSSGPITLEKKLSLGPHLADLLVLNQEIHSVPTADALSALPESPTDGPTTRLVLLYIVHGDQMVLELDADDEYWLPHTWYHKDVDIDSSSEAFKALEKNHMLQPS